MFDYLCIDLSKSNSENLILKYDIKILKEKPIATKNSLSLMNKENSNISLSNKFFFTKRENSHEIAKKLQLSFHNWAHPHFNLNTLINAQIPY